MGSFLGCLSDRWENTLSQKRSVCDKCQKPLPFWCLIPVFSWFFLKGKTKCCHQDLSVRHPLQEILVSSVLLLNINLYPLHNIDLFIFQITSLIVLWIAFVDNRWKQIPVIGLSFLFGITVLYIMKTDLWSAAFFSFLEASALLAIIQLVMKINKKPTLPLGDILLIEILSFWISFQMLPWFFVSMGVISFFYGLFWLYKNDHQNFPFAPSIIFSWWMCVLSCGR